MTQVDLSSWGTEPPLFVRLLAAEVIASDRTKAAALIGMSRTTVSLVLANKYSSPSTSGVERRVMDVLGRIDCVAIDEAVTVEQCQAYRERSAPTHNPVSMRQWRACQDCDRNPNCGGASNATIH